MPTKKTKTDAKPKKAAKAAATPRKAKQRWQVGDVFEIALPNGQFAYGRVYKEASVGIYRKTTPESGHPPIGSNDFAFIVGMYRDVLESGKVKIVGHDPFPSDDAAWAPPRYIYDIIAEGYDIYHHGKSRPAKGEEWKGLEQAAVWDYDDIVKRILAGGDAEASKSR
jgi:hypothetical protein